MPKPAPYRLDRSVYPHSLIVPTRISDVDHYRHLGNAAVGRIIEEGRNRFNAHFDVRPPLAGYVGFVVSQTINFLGQAQHPDDIEVCTGIGVIGRSSWTLHQAAFRGELAIATCDTTMTSSDANGACPIPQRWREGMERVLIKAPV